MKKLIILLLIPFITFAQTQIGQSIDGAAEGDVFGGVVSLSSDGAIMAVAATSNSANGENSGHVRVYENINGTWTQIGDDIEGEAEGDASGIGLALSANGTIVAIGAPGHDGNAQDYGQVRIFENVNNTWTLIGDIDGEAVFDQSGFSVSISANGNVVAIGAPLNNSDGGTSGDETDFGQVRVYENVNGTWTQIGDDIDGEAESDKSGSSISLSSDGSIVAIGAQTNDGNGFVSGHVRVYENQNNSWIQLGDDIDGEGEDNWSGSSVKISSDGSIVAIGARFNSDSAPFAGHVRVFQNIAGIWTQIGDDIDGEAQGDESGTSIGLSANGSVVAIGAQSNDGNGTFSGHVRIYQNIAGVWTQAGNDIDGEMEFSQASRVGLSGDGKSVAIGGPGNNSLTGNVRVFDLSTVLSVEEITQISFSLYPNPASGQFNIELENGTSLEKTIIYNSLGQEVYVSTETSILTSNLSSGVYIVEVITNQGKATKRLIIK